MDKNDTSKIITTMAALSALDPSGISMAAVLLLSAAVVIRREF
jgi:hypothetical protein